MSSGPALPVQVGEVLAGKYRVERVIGVGGMGVVVAALHVDLDELRAIKFMLPQAIQEPTSVERFLREARAAVRLRSEHVARVHDVGRLDSGAPYIVMEHLEGFDLLTHLRQRGAVDPATAATWVIQACEAVAEAHAAGIVHRDLKPANLFATGGTTTGRIKVLDFGISKFLDTEVAGDGGDLTNTTAMIGSPSYMSPEQIRSSKMVDARTDIWSLGVILYQLLTGELPFRAPERLALCMAVVQDPAAPPSTVRADLPPGLDSVVMRCLEKRPDARFATAAELAAALLPFAPSRPNELLVERMREVSSVAPVAPASRSDGAAPPAVTPPPSAGGGPHTDASWGNTGSTERRPRRALGLAIGGAALVAVAFAAFALTRGPSGDATPEAAPARDAQSARPQVQALDAPSPAPPPAPTTSATPGPATSGGATAADNAGSFSSSTPPGSARPAGMPKAQPKPVATAAPVPTAPSPAAPKPSSDPFGTSRK